MSLANEVGAAGVKTAPAIAVAAGGVAGWGIEQWMYAATFVYVIAQLGYLGWKWHREWRRRE